jgi:hypothetical protein
VLRTRELSIWDLISKNEHNCLSGLGNRRCIHLSYGGPSAVYFARLRIRGKLIRKTLKTDVLSVAKLRLAD